MAELPSAMEVVNAADEACNHYTEEGACSNCLAAAIERDRAQVREAALEEAAKVADDASASGSNPADAAAESIAAAIRFLIGQPSQSAPAPHPQEPKK